MTTNTEHARECCHRESERLKLELQACDLSFPDPKANHRCTRAIARRSGERARRCIRRG
jgi:hypothetical protein